MQRGFGSNAPIPRPGDLQDELLGHTCGGDWAAAAACVDPGVLFSISEDRHVGAMRLVPLGCVSSFAWL